MKKVLYLNFNLENPVDLQFYNFLNNLGRNKKAVILLALKNMGVGNATVTDIYIEATPPHKKQMSQKREVDSPKKISTDTPKPWQQKDQDEQDNLSETIVLTTQQEPILEPKPISAESVEEPKVDYTEPVESYERILSAEQRKMLDAYDKDYKSLSIKQLEVLAEELNNGTPVKAAYTTAQFTETE